MLLLLAAVLFLSPSLVSSAGEYFSTNGNQIVNRFGDSVVIRGINWFGFETDEMIPHGLLVRNYKELLDQLKELGFNALRIPFSTEMIKSTETVLDIDYSINSDLENLIPLRVLDKVVDYCTQIDLRIVLDRHSCKKGAYEEENLWYVEGDADCTEQVWIDDWQRLARRYKGVDTIIGADLFNEPKRNIPTWGTASPLTDWNQAAQRCGNAILSEEPNWLIFVEGITSFAGTYSWWGANLIGVATYPIQLNSPNKLVYSIHDYPSSVGAQSWFTAADYPNNLDEIWGQFWGYLFEQQAYPILIGEFGTKLVTDSDKLWITKLMEYCNGDWDLDGVNHLTSSQQGISWMYWSLNPNSGDTGGILRDDWRTVRLDKMSYLTDSLAPSSISLEQVTRPPAQAPTAVPTMVPTGLPSTFLASFDLNHLIEKPFDSNSTTAYAIAETVANVLNLTNADVRPIDTPTTSNLRGRYLQSIEATAYVEATVSSLAFPGYGRDSSALYLVLYSHLNDAIQDGSFNSIYQSRLACCNRFPVALVELLLPGAISTGIGGPVEPLYFPTIAPTSSGKDETSTRDKKADGRRDLAVVTVVVLVSACIICFAFSLFMRERLKSDAAFQRMDSMSEGSQKVLMTASQKQENRVSVRMQPSSADIDANEVYQDSIRKLEEQEQIEADKQFEEYQMILARKESERNPMITNSPPSFLEKGYNFISKSFSASKDHNQEGRPLEDRSFSESDTEGPAISMALGGSSSADSNSSASFPLSIGASSSASLNSPEKSEGDEEEVESLGDDDDELERTAPSADSADSSVTPLNTAESQDTAL